MNSMQFTPKELQAEYAAFLMEEKQIAYYTKRFQKIKKKNSPFNFNIFAFFFSVYWCFYRKMFGWGCLGFLLTLIGLYSNFAYGISTVSAVISFFLSVFFGCFGNYCYLRYVEKSIAYAQTLPPERKKKYYKENGGNGTKMLLCILFVSLVISFALAASFGIPGVNPAVNTTTTP